MPAKGSTRNAKTRLVAFQPATYRGVQQGINKLANAIRPTLGPRPRIVAIDRILDDRMPELLDNGGLIAKRIIQLPGWHEDVGAMYLRDVLWRLHEQVGDGTATAAVLFQFIYNKGVRYITSGGNAIRLRAALEQGTRVIVEQLAEMTVHKHSKEDLAQIAQTVCYDPPLANMLGEIFEIIGEYGRLEIREGRTQALEREYVEGMYWERGLCSREMITDHKQVRTEFENTAILISDLEIEEPQQLYPALELALRAKIGTLMIVADKLSDRAIGFLLANKKPDKFQVMAVHTPGYGKTEQAAALEDLAILTGGQPFIKVAGDTFEKMKVTDFGRTRRAWADHRNFGVIGGKGDPRQLRRHITSLQTAYDNSGDRVARDKLLKRIGKLMGGSATLWVGAPTELQIKARVEVAKRTSAAMRGAMTEGVVPGGGAALLACRPALQRLLDQSTDADERAAYHILVDAVAEPFRAIVANAGYDDRDILAELNLVGPGHVFDVNSGQALDVDTAGIYDAATTQKSAVYAAIAGVGLALTIDVLVHCNGDEPAPVPNQSPGKRKQL
jgi:chaperonin GroEL